jgi:hypothetical protein
MKKYSALLWEKWQIGEKPDEIIGKWAEDCNPYTVTVPAQLRGQLLEIQNLLAARYAELERFQRECQKYEDECNRLLPNTKAEGAE